MSHILLLSKTYYSLHNKSRSEKWIAERELECAAGPEATPWPSPHFCAATPQIAQEGCYLRHTNSEYRRIRQAPSPPLREPDANGPLSCHSDSVHFSLSFLVGPHYQFLSRYLALMARNYLFGGASLILLLATLVAASNAAVRANNDIPDIASRYIQMSEYYIDAADNATIKLCVQKPAFLAKLARCARAFGIRHRPLMLPRLLVMPEIRNHLP